MVSVPEIEKRRVPINKAWLMSCVNARYEDLAAAAGVVKDKEVAPGVEFYLAAASAEVQERATRDGHWQTLLGAGAIELPPGCGTCIGLGRGTIKAGEVGISATNRNFEGRMGDKQGLVYLASPAVVAASAIAGYVCAPERYDAAAVAGVNKTAVSARPAPSPGDGVQIIPGFPERIAARLLWLDRDNLNTDGIYAGKHTYNDKMTPAEMAGVIFENYDDTLRSIARPGDVIVSGLNFGTGSSREQAATALKHFGIACVVAASFSETYKRNAFNNGFVCFECPALVAWLRSHAAAARAGDGPPAKTVIAGDAEVDYAVSVVRLGNKDFPFPPLSPVAQDLVVAGGAENVVIRRLAEG
jgi:homoaconitate hydratase